MPKVEYKGLVFDSQLEVDYCKWIERRMFTGEILDFQYHPAQIQNLVGKRSYTPDFLVAYPDRIEIVECKGYNPYSKMIDDQIHNVMLSKNEEWLKAYICDCKYKEIAKGRLVRDCWNIVNKKVVYRKVKYLKALGFVDWDFKNPNTIANKRKAKINEQQDEIKALREFKKNAERYFKYHLKIVDNQKLTKPQREWYFKYVEELRKEYSE